MSRRRRYASLVALALLLTAPAVAQNPPDDPPGGGPPSSVELVFGEDGIGAIGLTPRGLAAVFGVGRVPLEYLTRVVRHEVILEVDADGAIVWELPDGVPLRSVWAVVDLESGAMATSSAPEFPGRVEALPIGALRRGPPGAPGRFGFDAERAQVLYVRTKAGGGESAGAWKTSISEGGGRDVDGVDDGSIEMELGELAPVPQPEPEPGEDDPAEEEPEEEEPEDETPSEDETDSEDGTGEEDEETPEEEPEPEDPFASPVEPRPGDVLLVVDSRKLALYTLRVTPQLLNLED